jgi:uncharacterized membrane protein (DUF106 family)
MNGSEHQQDFNMGHSTGFNIHEIIVRMDRMEKKQDAIHSAMMGGELMGEDGGMVARLKRVEQKADHIEKELSRYKSMFKGMWVALGIALSVVLWLLRELGFLKNIN